MVRSTYSYFICWPKGGFEQIESRLIGNRQFYVFMRRF